MSGAALRRLLSRFDRHALDNAHAHILLQDAQIEALQARVADLEQQLYWAGGAEAEADMYRDLFIEAREKLEALGSHAPSEPGITIAGELVKVPAAECEVGA